MKKYSAFVLFFFIITCMSLLFNGCIRDDEDDNSAIVTINTGLNNNQSKDHTTRAAAPPIITSIILTISAADMATISAGIDIVTGNITLNVPAGSSRLFQVTADSPYSIYRGSQAQNLTANESASVTITMQSQAKLANVTINPAYTDGMPSNIISYTARITAVDMDDIEQTFPFGTPISIDVPAGTTRSISVTAAVDSEDQGIVKSWAGSDSVDLSADTTNPLTLNLSIDETKIVIPDFSNNRLAQIDSMSEAEATWDELTGTQIASFDTGRSDPFSLSDDFRPYDIDFDSRGRIYIANNYGYSLESPRNWVIRINNFSSTNYSLLPETSQDDGFVAIAVDRKNNYLYYATDNNLFRSDYDGKNVKNDFTLTGINTIQGIAVDDSGILYIAGATVTAAVIPRIFKYDPVNENVTHTYTVIDTSDTPWDVMVKYSDVDEASYVYAAIYNSGKGTSKIIQLDLDLNSVTVKELTGNPDLSDTFLGPHRFLAAMNRRFYVIDEDEYDYKEDRIVAFDDIVGKNWETFYPTSIDRTAFQFYSSEVMEMLEN